MRRSKMRRGHSRRLFKRTAMRTHKMNGSSAAKRGGIRL